MARGTEERLEQMAIRIEWGGVTAYVDGGLFTYCWDGGITVENGSLCGLERLLIDVTQHGVKSEQRVPMTGPTWCSTTCDTVDGVLYRSLSRLCTFRSCLRTSL